MTLFEMLELCADAEIRLKNHQKNVITFEIPDGDVDYQALLAIVSAASNKDSSFYFRTKSIDKILKMGLESNDSKFKSKCIEGIMFIANQEADSYYIMDQAVNHVEKIRKSVKKKESSK